MSTLILTRGLPASGKTTKARQWVAAADGRARVNRDDLRASLYGRDGILGRAEEDAITRIQRGVVSEFLKSGTSVVVDDMNLRAKYAREWADLAAAGGADLGVWDFTGVPLEECIRRDKERLASGGRGVGEDVIRGIHAKFLASGRLAPVATSPTTSPAVVPYVQLSYAPSAWIVDIDGTLALMGDRRGPFEWDKVNLDTPHWPVIDLVSDLTDAVDAIIVMSGRDEVCRPATEEWLRERGVPFDHLYMRPAGDCRPDSVVKLELFDRHIRYRYLVRGVLDDRDQVVRLWRSLGLLCLQVADGDF